MFSSPDAVGQGDLNAPVHPVAGSERIVQTMDVAGVGRVELWAATGSTPTGACLGLRFPDGTWGARAGSAAATPPACFTERDDPIFKDTLIATGIDAFETDVDSPFTRIVYGIIDWDRPATAVTIVDRVTGATAPVSEGRFFAYVDPRADRAQGRPHARGLRRCRHDRRRGAPERTLNAVIPLEMERGPHAAAGGVLRVAEEGRDAEQLLGRPEQRIVIEELGRACPGPR